MSRVYGWRYAHDTQGQGSVKRKKNVRKNSYVRSERKPSSRPPAGQVRQYYKAQKMAPPSMGVLNKSGRYVVALMLVLISLTVVSKEPLLKGLIWNQVGNWGAQLRTAIKPDHRNKAVSKRPAPNAVAAPQPVAGSLSETPAVARERAKPLALIADQGLFLLDSNGQIWPLGHDQAVDVLPVVTGVRLKEMPGAMGVVLTGEVDTAVVKTILAQPFSDQLSELHFNNHDLILYTRDGIKIKMNPARHLYKDLVRLQAVLGDLRAKARQIASIDMRYDQQLVVRPVGRR